MNISENSKIICIPKTLKPQTQDYKQVFRRAEPGLTFNNAL